MWKHQRSPEAGGTQQVFLNTTIVATTAEGSSLRASLRWDLRKTWCSAMVGTEKDIPPSDDTIASTVEYREIAMPAPAIHFGLRGAKGCEKDRATSGAAPFDGSCV